MKVYIAGPIAGYPNLNREAFEEASEKLIKLGYEPVNPHNVEPLNHDGPCFGESTQGDHSYGCYMIPDLLALLSCQGYTLLSGWQYSRGAIIEEQVARICGHEFVILQ